MDTYKLAVLAERARLARAGQPPARTNSQRLRELERYVKEIEELKARVERLEWGLEGADDVEP